MNKYQDALCTLTDWFHSYHDANGLVHEKHIDEEYQKAKDTIQELICNTETAIQVEIDKRDRKLIKYLDKNCKGWREEISKGDEDE